MSHITGVVFPCDSARFTMHKPSSTVWRVSDMTPEFVRDYLRDLAGIEIDMHEAERLVPYIRGARFGLNRLYRFDVQHLRPSLSFDPTFPYDSHDADR